MKWYLKTLTENYANFNGRARREEYWMFVLFQIIAIAILCSIFAGLEGIINDSIPGVFILLFFGGTLIPWLAINVRRLHDIGKSGTYLFINLIPIIGRIWYIVLVASNGDYGPNQYGPDPKATYVENDIEQIGRAQDD